MSGDAAPRRHETAGAALPTLPYLHSYLSDGKRYVYFRRRGVRLRLPPLESPEFDTAYRRAARIAAAAPDPAP